MLKLADIAPAISIGAQASAGRTALPAAFSVCQHPSSPLTETPRCYVAPLLQHVCNKQSRKVAGASFCNRKSFPAGKGPLARA
jgi:hypothetical protein